MPGVVEHPLFVAIVAPIVVAAVLGCWRLLRAIHRAVTVDIPATLTDHTGRLDAGERRFRSLEDLVSGVREDLSTHMTHEEAQREELIQAIRSGTRVGRAAENEL